MNKQTSTVLISLILILMIITISVVLKISGSVMNTLVGNNTKNTIDKNILNTTVAYNNTTYNNTTNTTTNTVSTNTTNEVVYVNNVSNSISIENTTSQNISVQNTVARNEVNPPTSDNEIKGIYANTGIIRGLNDSIQQAVITTDDVFESFLTQYNISRNISGISNYMSESYFRTNNLGIIYVPLEEGQTFEIVKQGESGGVLYVNLILNPSYSDYEKTGGMLVLIELDKNTTNLQVTS